MTDKQLERANQIKKEITNLEILRGLGISYSGDGIINLFENPVYAEFVNIEKRITKRWNQLVDSKITALQKEFAKL